MITKPTLGRRAFLRAGSLFAAAPLAAPLIATGLVPTAARAATPAISQPSWYRFAIGDHQATILSDGLLDLGSAADQLFRAHDAGTELPDRAGRRPADAV